MKLVWVAVVAAVVSLMLKTLFAPAPVPEEMATSSAGSLATAAKPLRLDSAAAVSTAPKKQGAAPDLISLADRSGHAPELVLEISTGKGPDALGVGNEEQDPRGPMAFAVSATGRMAYLDSFNKRLQVRDASGKVVKNVPFPEGSVLRHVTSDSTERFHVLETTDQGEILVRSFSESGDALTETTIKTDDKYLKYAANAFRLQIGAAGTIYLVSPDQSYKRAANGRAVEIPGIPFENDESKFLRLDGTNERNRRISTLDSKGQVIRSVPLENDYLSIKSMQTDSQGRAYVEYHHVLESAPLKPGGEPVQSYVGIVEQYSPSGQREASTMLDFDGEMEVDHPLVIDTRKGEVYVTQASKKTLHTQRASLR